MKKLPLCPKCKTELRVIKSWASNAMRKQRMECKNGHRVTANIETTFDKRSLIRLVGHVHS